MENVQVEPLNFGRTAQLRKKWMRMWERLGHRIIRMPEWMQEIVLEDVNTAIRNRIATMEMIQQTRRAQRC
jgi:hypothetical protein